MIGVDTSFLVGLAVQEHPDHQRCWALFEREIVGGEATMAMTPQVLAEFCHIVTDERRFERPLAMHEALELCEQWWNARECRPVAVDAEAGALFLTWMHQHRLGRKRLLDTLLAATYHRAGIERLATTDWRDFARYGVFEVKLL
ncbi:MAG TPA: type II toxin-antitoxin system VapC family toxin [Thermoanaerobaculia bacterium]|nr:type II toxin-antitoxin system VapC family toxin [Thermoanaerobaculia bacterium]